MDENTSTKNEEMSPELIALKKIEESLNILNQKSIQLQESFDKKIKVDMHKEKMFDNMHDELTQYRNDIVNKIANSIILDIIQLLDIYQRIITETDNPEIKNQMENVCQDLQDILYRNNVEPFSLEEIDLKKQKIIKYVKTEEDALHNSIAQHLAPGYEKEGKVIRPERIAIFRKES